MEKIMGLSDFRKAIDEKQAELREKEAQFQNESRIIKSEIAELERRYQLAIQGVDIDRIVLAESVLNIRGLNNFNVGTATDVSVVNALSIGWRIERRGRIATLTCETDITA
jgi:hypothetical protein